MKNRIATAKKQAPQLDAMTVEIVEKGTTKEEARRLGFLKQNRPIIKANVVNFLQIIDNGKYEEAYPIMTQKQQYY